MILALLLAVWTWDRVTLNCQGGPETVSHYYLQATMRDTLMIFCLDDQGLPSTCPVSIPADPIPFGPDIPDPGTGVSVSTWFDPVENPELLPLPGVGGLAAWPWLSEESEPVVAVDAAGNSSGDTCP